MRRQSLCFYTLGPEFTTLIRNLWRDKPQAALHHGDTITIDGATGVIYNGAQPITNLKSS